MDNSLTRILESDTFILFNDPIDRGNFLKLKCVRKKRKKERRMKENIDR